MEIAALLKFIRDRRIRNVVFITGDVHYAPPITTTRRARRSRSFIRSGIRRRPGPRRHVRSGKLDKTFGPEVKFLGIPAGMKPNRPPNEGLQFFGTLKVMLERGR